MELNVCKEIVSVHVNGKTIASLQPHVSPGRYDLKLQANEIDFENCLAQKYIKNPDRKPFQSSSLFAMRTSFFICFFIELFLHCFKWLFLYFTD